MSEHNILFSVVIPTYNRAEKLARCLKSLEQQTFQNFEVLVCDDGSKDHTADVVRQFEDTGLHIRYLYNENWGGPARPRNVGIAAARGVWVCFLDSDDYWYAHKLAVCCQYLENADIVYHRLDIITPEGKGKTISPRQLNGDTFRDLLINGNTILTSGTCVRKSALEAVNGFSEEKETIAVEDYDLWLKLSKAGFRFRLIEESLGGYWVGEGHITSRDMKQVQRINKVYADHLPFLTENDQVLAENMKAYKLAKVYHQMGDFRQAATMYRKSLLADNAGIKIRSVFFLILAWLKRPL